MTHLAMHMRTSEVALKGVSQVTSLLAEAREPDKVLPDALHTLCQVLAFNDAAIGYLDERARFTTVRSRRPAEPPLHMPRLVEEAWTRVRRSQMPWVIESQWSEAVADAALDLCEEADLDRSAIAVPITWSGCVRGVLCVERLHGPGDQAEFCFDDDVRSLRTVAQIVASTGCGHVPSRAALRDTESARRVGGAVSARGNPSLRTDRTGEEQRTAGVGRHPSWLAAVAKACVAARTNATILLRGESGTGKEVLAQVIHAHSPRREAPFVSVNCAALPDSLLESELFGHERGAFTGATSQRKGRFELADKGTLFLDEIGDISSAFQASLLRALQLGEFERVGGTETLRVQVRVIAATHRDLEQAIREDRFREDLYYRLNVIPILLPPLRQRRSDIPALATHLLNRLNRREGSNFRLDNDCFDRLMAHDFPGNIRELENAICRAASLSEAECLTAEDFAFLSDDVSRPSGSEEREDRETTAVDMARRELTRDEVIDALERAGWVQAKAARLLGVTARRLGYAVRRYQIQVRRL